MQRRVVLTITITWDSWWKRNLEILGLGFYTTWYITCKNRGCLISIVHKKFIWEQEYDDLATTGEDMGQRLAVTSWSAWWIRSPRKRLANDWTTWEKWWRNVVTKPVHAGLFSSEYWCLLWRLLYTVPSENNLTTFDGSQFWRCVMIDSGDSSHAA